MGAAIPAYEGTADIWVDKNKAYIFLHLLQHQRNIPIHILYPKIQQSGNNIKAEVNLRKHYNFQVDVKDACDTLAEKMNEVLASE